MRKLYFLLLFVVALLNTPLMAQQAYIKAPAVPSTTSSIKAPNGTSAHAAFKGCYLLTASDLSVVATNTALNAIGFYLNQGTSGPAVTGTIQVYLQNTNDLTYQKGISYTNAIAPMTSVYNSTMIVPAGGTNTITLMFPSNFTYTGSGLYVAFDWVTTGPFSSGAAIYQADATLGSAGAAVSSTLAPAPDVLGANSVRPAFRIGYINTLTNEAEAYGVLGNGRQPLYNGSPYSFSVVVRNNAGVAMTNVVPTLSISGANNFVTTTTIASIPAGGTLVAAFPSYTPTSQGMNTVSVIFPPDGNNGNNVRTVTQSVTCNYLNTAPPVAIGAFNQGVGFSTSSGLLLTRINVPNTSTLNALRLGIANYGPNAGNSVYGVITNSSGIILGTTSTINITGTMFGSYQTFNFASPVAMTGNTDYFIGMAQPANTLTPYFPLASMPSASNNIPNSLYATSFIGGGFIGIQTPTLGWFAVEGVFYNTVSLTVTPQSSTICSGTPATLTASGATSYSWSNGASTSSISVSPNLYTVYTATGTAIVGTVGVCEDIKTSSISVNITPTLVCPNGAICPVGGSFTLNPSGAATYTFGGGGPVVSPGSTTSYTITGTSAAGCPAINTVIATVSVSANPTITIAGPTLICNGSNASLTAQGALTFTWSEGTIGNSILVSPATSTIYNVFGTFGTCTTSAFQTVSVSPNPTLSAQTSNTLLCIGNTATLSGFGASTYSWSTGQVGLTATVSPSVNTTYTLIGAINGICADTVTFTQNVVSCIGIETHNGTISEISVYPNPNSGVFTVFVSSVNENTVIQLYNGLGQLVATEKLTETTTELNLKTLPKGVYMLKLKENGQAIKTTRVIIQ